MKLQAKLMTTVTVTAIIDFDAKPKAPLTQMMNRRLEGFSADLQTDLERQLLNVHDCDTLIIYMSYNSNYSIRWAIVNEVPEYISGMVADRCALLGYIFWKDIDVHKFK